MQVCINWIRTTKLGVLSDCFWSCRICLSVDIVGYLAYLGVSSAEEIIVNHGRNLDVKHPSRSNHLVVRALYEVLLIIRYIDHKKLTNEERHVFRALTGKAKASVDI